MPRSRTINFRASPQLAEVLAQTAEREGVTVSDLVRQAIEERVAKAPGIEPQERAKFDPFGHLAAASRGSLAAQRAMANVAVQMALERNDAGEFVRDPELTLSEGLVFARLAAAQGEIADQGLVISMIALLAQIVGEENVEDLMGEAMARVSMMADLGNHHAGDMLPNLAESCSAETMAQAKHYTTRIQDEVFGK